MTTYRKRPVEVEAVQWTGRNTIEIGEFLGETAWHFWVGTGVIALRVAGGAVLSSTVLSVKAGDWIVAEPDGMGFYPCAAAIFETTYEPVTEAISG